MNRSVSVMNGGGIADDLKSGLKSDDGALSSLQIFVKAKKKINEIYNEVDTFVTETQEFIQTVPDVLDLESLGASSVEASSRKVTAIKEVLQRNHMKVVFFGRTSNGKSTAINALLGNQILPTGIGHTTSCFLQVEGGSGLESYILTEDSDERKSVESISHLAHALCDESLDPNAKIRIVWPQEKCKMLGQEVVIIDSPGIDVETDLDEWIDKYCLDSDVFVLVANAESTLMLTEKKFFHKVSERLSNPNIFIVHNRSDAFAGEEMHAQVKRQHLERAVKFLVEELGVYSNRSEAEDRIFFISAKEALHARLQESKGLPPQISTEDFFPRYLEFQNFEKKFTTCLSHTAVKTKFAMHTQRGLAVVKSIASLMNDVHFEALKHHKIQSDIKKELWEKCDYTERQLELLTLEMKEKISSFTEEIEYKVCKAMSEEIRKLSILVDEFNDQFHPDPLVLNVYKSKLNHHIESGVGSNLKSRLSSDLQMNMENHQKEMIDRMTSLLPAERQQVSRNLLPRRETFEVLYHLNCDNLCSDFQEDIRFRFSLGIVSLAQRFLGSANSRKVTTFNNRENIPRSLDSPVTPPTNEFFVPQDDWSLISKVAIATLTSQGTMGGLLLGGLLLKTVGWRFVAVSAAVYGGIYAYERLTWTNYAKCKEFKKQYVEHAARKFRLIVDMTSANCSHQVQQELSSTFARLCHLVDETSTEIKEDIKHIDTVVKDLEETANQSKLLRNRANFISNKLELFERSYLGGNPQSDPE